MQTHPLVSILIPAFNAQKWISETIESALNQTWKNKEIIVVDDGSTDETVNVVNSFQSPIIKIFQQENTGACRARNRAFKESQGEYIQWLDADDLLAPDKIAQQMHALGSNPDPEIICSSAWKYFFVKTETGEYKPTHLWQDLDPSEWLCRYLSKPWFFMPSMGWLISRPLTEKSGPWDERLLRNQDGEYFFRVVSFSRFVKFVPEAFCFYRMDNPASISRNRSRPAWESQSLSMYLITQHALAREDSERTRTACMQSLNRAMTVFEKHAPDLAQCFRQHVIDLGGKPEYVFNSRKYALLQSLIGKKVAHSIWEAVYKNRRRIPHRVDRMLSRITIS